MMEGHYLYNMFAFTTILYVFYVCVHRPPQGPAPPLWEPRLVELIDFI